MAPPRLQRTLAAAAALTLALVAVPSPGEESPASGLAGLLSQVDWTRTPFQVLLMPQDNEAVVWAGVIESFSYRDMGAEKELEWVCRHLHFGGPMPTAIAQRPLPVRESQEGLFVVTIVKAMSDSEVQKMAQELEARPHYVLVGGRFEASSLVNGTIAARVKTVKLELSDSLVKFVP